MSTPPVNSCNSSAGLVEKYINSAYDNVKAVADNLDYLDQIYQFLLQYGLITNIAVKAPVQAVATSPITLSGNQVLTWSAHSGDYSVLATTGMRVLVLGQTNPVENGIYDVQNNAWTRSVDFDGPKDVVDGTLVFSSQGDVWQVDGPQYSLVPGTDPIVFRDIDLFAYEALREATEKAQEAAASAAAALASEQAAKVSENIAASSETHASNSAAAAAISETNAKVSEDAAKVSENNAKSSELAAQNLASLAESVTNNTLTFATTAAGIAGTTNGQYFRVPQGSGATLSFIYYLNNSGTAQVVAEMPGKGTITNNIRSYSSLAVAQADVTAGNILNGTYCYVRNSADKVLADEYINNAGTLEATGRMMPSQQSVDESHKNVLGYLTDALPNLYRFKTLHCQTTPVAQANNVTGSWFIFPDVLPAGLISKIELAIATAGKVYVATFSKSGNVFTRKWVKSFDAAAGTVSLTPEMLADDGDYIGIYTEGGLYFNSAVTIPGTVYRWASTAPTDNTALDVSLAIGSYNYTFQVRVTALHGSALSIPTDALNTQLIGVASRLDNLSEVERSGVTNRMFLLTTPVEFDSTITELSFLANNPLNAIQTIRTAVYRPDGENYTLVDKSEVSLTPVDSTVITLPLDLNTKAGDLLVFSAPVCFDTKTFGSGSRHTACAIYIPPDNVIPSSIPKSSFVTQTGLTVCVRFVASFLIGNAEKNRGAKNTLIDRMLKNADGVYLSAARPLIFDQSGVYGTINTVYVPSVINYSSVVERRSITLSNALVGDKLTGPYTAISFDALDFRDLKTNYRLIYIDLSTNTLRVISGVDFIPVRNILPVIEIYGRADDMNWRVFGGLASVIASGVKNGDVLADLYDAMTNPLRDSHIGLIGDSITWGLTASGIATQNPRSHQLSDARNNFTSKSWANLFRRWSAELSCHGKNVVETQSAGMSTYYNTVNIEVNQALQDFTPLNKESGLLTQLRGETLRQDGANRSINIQHGSALTFQFSGTAITLVYATLKNLNVAIYVDGVLKSTVVTDDSAVPAFGTTLTISGLSDGAHVLRIETAETSGDAFRLQYIRRNKSHSVMNSGIIGTNTGEWLPGGSLLVSAALPTNVTHILIQLGTNDRGMAAGPSYLAGAQGTFSNLVTIVKSLRNSYPGVKIILVAPPYAPDDGDYGSSDEVARAVRRAARVLECGFVDQYSATLEVELQGESWLNSDRLHPNDYGHRVMFRNLQNWILMSGNK